MPLCRGAHVRTLQTEICGPTRCACPITALVYLATEIAIVVKRLDEACVSVGRLLAGVLEEGLDVFWTDGQLESHSISEIADILQPKACAVAVGLFASPTTEALRVGVRVVVDMLACRWSR